jgi:cysteinyl-tRNA synthetase
MSITFREFVELIEGKKKDLKRLKSAYMAGQELAPRQSVNIPAGEPNSPERAAAIKELMRASGGGAVRSAIKEREKKAAKAAKNILNQEGFSYGSKSFQQELEKKRKKEAEEKETQRQQNADSARRAFRTKGVPFSDSKGKGHIVNGVKQYDT